MSEKKKRPPALAAFLVVGIAFITIGISSNSAFIPIGCAFIVIGIAGIASSRKAAREETPPDDSNND
jgi:ABC-type antimicrobial peptide transport system permease subunit